MASHQVGATPVEDVITETEAINSKEPPQVAAPPPLPPVEPVHTLDIEDEAEGLEELTATPYEAEKIDTFSDDHDEEKDNEYSSFKEREDAAATFRPTGDPATFGEFDDDDDDAEDEDDA